MYGVSPGAVSFELWVGGVCIHTPSGKSYLPRYTLWRRPLRKMSCLRGRRPSPAWGLTPLISSPLQIWNWVLVGVQFRRYSPVLGFVLIGFFGI